MENIELTYANNNELRLNIDHYNSVVIFTKDQDTDEIIGPFEYELTNELKNIIQNSNENTHIGYIIYNNIIAEDKPQHIYKLFLKKNIEGGGGKNKIKIYSVKELRDIALRNKLKITKKINGKIVSLNKQELIIKMKKKNVRYYYL